jgi:hypothetical protein
MTPPPVNDRLHKFGAYRIEQTVQACEELPHSHVTPQLLLALFDRETLLQNIIGAGDDDTGVAQLNRKVWHDLLKSSKGCPSGTWVPDSKHTAADRGYCPQFKVSLRTAQYILIAHISDAGQNNIPWPDRLYVAVAAYNAGMGGAFRGWEEGHIDKYTAAPRHDYSKDVIDTRRPQIESWLRENHYL